MVGCPRHHTLALCMISIHQLRVKHLCTLEGVSVRLEPPPPHIVPIITTVAIIAKYGVQVGELASFYQALLRCL